MFDSRKIRLHCKRTERKIRIFLLRKESREFLIFLFFVFVSASFWLLQTLDDHYETEFSVPLKLKNVPEDVVITSDLPSDLRVTVSDRGTVLINYMLGRTFYPVVVNFDEYADGTSAYVRVPYTDVMKKVTMQLNTSTTLVSMKPDTLGFVCAKGIAKKIPVKLDGTVAAARKYYISDIRFQPDSVVVYAPKAVLDTIHAAYTIPVELKDVSDTLRNQVALKHVYGAKFVPNVSDLTVLTDMYAEKTVEVPVTGVGFPAGKVLRTFPSKVQVTFQVGLNRFKEVNAIDFAVEVDYKNLPTDGSSKLKPVLRQWHPAVSHIRISPAELDYLIEQQ